MKTKISDILGEVNSPYAPLEESYFNSPYYHDFLSHERFHHSEKGCQVEMCKAVSNDNHLSITKKCLTHNVECSKTGWELGWYLGTENRIFKKQKFYDIPCQRCGKNLHTRFNYAKYHRHCAILNGRETSRKHYLKIKDYIFK